ncbi:T9SS type B sorting domain-containing protein [Aggregatimonas sangjinii]|uniref:T9SS type B sorting domain-containing protein n=1 Tax=Aggregatimonas sangjinii TaxID=2583587 RepID=A0A5B7SW50_9FLAO|nr:T9SS type B sorting domain-containing protein [Aggregatimonas sangjinii]QCX00904.1 T9SS type B sorting domain-containing protein [Aggregatimonas sangjinii]
MNKRLGTFLIVLVYFWSSTAFAQIAPDCVNAIAICNNTPVNGGTNGFGMDDFGGDATTGCLERSLSGAIESNSAWYRFRTGASGQLGFNIGFDTSEDWDFALYRTDDCADLGEPVRCNFFDNTEENSFVGVGEDPTGNSDNFQYEDWLQVSPGEEYYLLINNFSSTNTGFSIQFSGAIFTTDPYTALDCSIVNNLLGPPITACFGDNVTLDATTTDATMYKWFEDTGSGMTEILGETSPTLIVTNSATYAVEVITVTNANITSNVQVVFSEVPSAFPVSDDASCSGLDRYDLSQKDSEVLGSQDPSQYIVSYYRSLSDANSGTNALPKDYGTQAGAETIYVRLSSLNNPNCFDVSERFDLINLETPVLDFPSEAFLCENGGSVFIGEANALPNYNYSWDSGQTSPGFDVSVPGAYTVTVTNTQGGLSCESARTVTVVESNPPMILDIEINDLQSSNTVTIITNTESEWEYRLDDEVFQSENTFYNVAPGIHTITVNDPRGCGAVTEDIVVVGFPKFFTPNLDGSNDNWHIVGIENLQSPKVYIFDRYGKLLRYLGESDPQGWDGTLNGKPLPETDYWFKLTYVGANGLERTAKYINNHFALKR